MKQPQSIVTDYELMQKFCTTAKEKGFELPESVFYWARTWGEYHKGNSEVAEYEVVQKLNLSQELWGDGFIPAYTASEWGEMLPRGFLLGKTESAYSVQIPVMWEEHMIKTYGLNARDFWELTKDTSEANAGCNMAQYLLDNNLLV